MHRLSVTTVLLAIAEWADANEQKLAHSFADLRPDQLQSVVNWVDELTGRALAGPPVQDAADLEHITLGKPGRHVVARGATHLRPASCSGCRTSLREGLSHRRPSLLKAYARPPMSNASEQGGHERKGREGEHATMPEPRPLAQVNMQAALALRQRKESVAAAFRGASYIARTALSPQSYPLHEDLVRRIAPAQTALLSAALNIFLSAFKIGVGSATGCAALLADGAHSFSDLAVDALSWVSVHLGARPPDAFHPRGYGHYEHLGSIGIAGMVIATGTALSVHSSGAVLEVLMPASASASAAAAAGGSSASTATAPQAAALELAPLLVAVASVTSKELLFRVTLAVGTQRGSPSTVANAYQIRSDALSSFVVLLSIVGTLLGCSWLDPLAATVVGMMMSAVGVEIAGGSVKALLPPSRKISDVGPLWNVSF